eukprot:CAMPEP_0113674746 /NCGR_PEP_ID=MMETSP0038_2-20120614/7609_1 /TAXON_ID=2898 /ORGANISM="Cryptomonas paramecium" /LENGTH=436 /DNA_ID=CAMNT_0000591399 /DNA_START=198 /DNA_END=1508 /DNA_ORIENTATION=+ /assembly_acc=CAM_ASM_000170
MRDIDGFSRIDEALLLAQSRARQAEEALAEYDSRVEETAARALGLLEECRNREIRAERALAEAQLAMAEHEQHYESAHRDWSVASSPPPVTTTLWLGMVGGAREEGRRTSWRWYEERHEALSIQLATAIGEVEEAREETQRRCRLLVELEGLVEPIIQLRHSGVIPEESWSTRSQNSEDSWRVGSSFVIVDRSSQNPEQVASHGCFATLAAQARLAQEAHATRTVLSQVQQALLGSESADEKRNRDDSSSRGVLAYEEARRLLPSILEKIRALVALVNSQRAEIERINAAFKALSESSSATLPMEAKDEPPLSAGVKGTSNNDHGEASANDRTSEQYLDVTAGDDDDECFAARAVVAISAAAHVLVKRWEKSALRCVRAARQAMRRFVSSWIPVVATAVATALGLLLFSTSRKRISLGTSHAGSNLAAYVVIVRSA